MLFVKRRRWGVGGGGRIYVEECMLECVFWMFLYVVEDCCVYIILFYMSLIIVL